MGRKLLSDRPLTNAERQKRFREKQKLNSRQKITLKIYEYLAIAMRNLSKRGIIDKNLKQEIINEILACLDKEKKDNVHKRFYEKQINDILGNYE